MELTKPRYRVASIDILRGIVMIIMALDHTRDFFHQPAFISDPLDLSTTTPVIFLTRWITHFCAPTFVFLSGVSAFLSSLKKTKNEASLFLIKRGLWLVLVEMSIVTPGITFKLYTIFIWQVIWAIGWSMVILGLLMRVSDKLVLVTGLLLFFGHNVLDYIELPSTGTSGALWNIFFRTSFFPIPLGPDRVIYDIYAILPWTGAMLLGYSVGHWFKKEVDPAKRKRNLITTGLALIGLFILLRATNLYGNPFPWQKQEDLLNNILAFINTSKYPPSLLYLCMTIGPACILLALLEKVNSSWSRAVSVYGTVPFLYYVMHFYLLHILLAIVFFASGYGVDEIVHPAVPFNFRPPTFGFSLPIVYLIWISVVAVLYFPCRWFSRYKQTHTQWWLSYL